MSDPRFSKYKYLLGEQLHYNQKFDGLDLPVGNIEGNTIIANSKWIAVSFYCLLIFF